MQSPASPRAAKLAAGHDYADGTAHPWHRQPVATLRKVRADLRAGFAPGTANQSLAAIRGALRVAWQDGSLDHGDYSRRVDALKSVPGSPAPGRVLTVAQVRDLFAACAADPNRGAGARDAALMAVLFGLGLRRGEARAIQAGDLDRAGGTLTVRGKAGRDRLAYTGGNGADAAIGAWLKIRGDHDGPLFAPVNRGGRVSAGGMSLQAISARVALRGRQAGLGDRLGCHVLRRSFVTALLDAGNDVLAVAGCAGHRSVATTQRYDRRGETAKRDAAATLAVPYVAPGTP